MAEFFAAYPALQTLAQILSEVLRWLVILPVLGFVIVWFRSMRQDLPENTPIAVLVNAATRDVTRIVNPETAIGRSRNSDIILNFPTISPVSYTHLDVYKRQTTTTAARIGSTPLMIMGRNKKRTQRMVKAREAMDLSPFFLPKRSTTAKNRASRR